MARTCTVCTHAERREIDGALVGGDSNRRIATRFRLSEAAVRRHAAGHLPATIARAHEAAEVAAGDNLLSQVKALQARAMNILGKAEAAGDLRAALAAIREARGNLELLAKLLGELDERPMVNILVSSEWLAIRTALMNALTPYVDARASVAEALLRLEAPNGHGA